MSMNFTSPFDTSKMNFVIPIHLLSKSGPNSSKIPLCTSSNQINQTFSKSSSNDYTKTRSSASFRKKKTVLSLKQTTGQLQKDSPWLPHVHSEKSKQNTPLRHKCSSPRPEPYNVASKLSNYILQTESVLFDLTSFAVTYKRVLNFILSRQ
jgi:hypothetical protein